VYAELVNRLSATRFGSWLVKHWASKVDPMIFRASNGRFTSTGKPTLPMLALTVVGRRSGAPRTVQLAYEPDGDDYLVVASAMGAEHHPAWRHNLEAAGRGSIQVRGRVLEVEASLLSDQEKAEVWPRITATIPQMTTYEQRTDRNIGVFRLRPIERSA
jgi:deazaflavin-dependent oxidoreductase (nitroreductase family)